MSLLTTLSSSATGEEPAAPAPAWGDLPAVPLSAASHAHHSANPWNALNSLQSNFRPEGTTLYPVERQYLVKPGFHVREILVAIET